MSVNITLLFLVMVRVWEKNFSFAQTKTNGRLYYIDLNLMANTRNPFRFSDNPLKTWWSVEYSVHKKIKCHGYRQTTDIEYNAMHCWYMYSFDRFISMVNICYRKWKLIWNEAVKAIWCLWVLGHRLFSYITL